MEKAPTPEPTKSNMARPWDGSVTTARRMRNALTMLKTTGFPIQVR